MTPVLAPAAVLRDGRSARSALLRVRGVSLHFDRGTTRALDGVDVEIGESEFIALMGASGCGKSSLLNLMGGLDRPTAGEIYFGSTAYSSLADLSLFRREHIGFVFQSFNLIPTLSALENVLVPTVGVKGARAAHERRARVLLDRLGVQSRAEHLPATMSGGERQRVAIARALINSPDVLLADEPTGSLDSANAAEVLDLIDDLRHEHGISVAMVTHDAAVSARADRIVRLRDGKVVDHCEARA